MTPAQQAALWQFRIPQRPFGRGMPRHHVVTDRTAGPFDRRVFEALAEEGLAKLVDFDDGGWLAHLTATGWLAAYDARCRGGSQVGRPIRPLRQLLSRRPSVKLS